MIWPWKRARIRATAYLPEHLSDYVLAVMGGEADLMNDHLCYSRGGTLVLVGYPLGGRFDSAALASVVERALRYYRPSLLSLIAPVIPPLDLAEEDQVLCQPEGGRGEEDFPVPEELLDREVAPDLPDSVAAPGKERIRMGDERGLDPLPALDNRLGMEPDEGIETPGVVEVAVGVDDEIQVQKVDIHLPGVID